MNRECALPGGAGVYPLTGDVASTAGNSNVVVTGLQQVPVENTTPDDLAYLKYSATNHEWEPTRIDGTGNLVLATPDGSPGDAILRSIVPADLPIATTSALGVVQPDGTTVTISAGVISASAASSLTLETDGTPNGSQTLLNLHGGTNVVLTDNGSGQITIDAPAAGSYSLGGTITTSNVSLGSGAGSGATLNIATGLDGNHTIKFTAGIGAVVNSAAFTVTFTTGRGHLTYPVINLTVISVGDTFDYPVSPGATGSATTYTAFCTKPFIVGNVYQYNISCP